ncbi:MAG: hypothetical protein IPH68_15660 [Chitinophagaceae bacterium]|nr:hypothetical protein [Chitinophagaceae bacterium]
MEHTGSFTIHELAEGDTVLFTANGIIILNRVVKTRTTKSIIQTNDARLMADITLIKQRQFTILCFSVNSH